MGFPKEVSIFVAGAKGLVGSAIMRCLQKQGYTNLFAPSRSQLDLMDQAAVARYFEVHRPKVVFLAAAKVGGIMANHSFPGEFIFENLLIQTHVIHHAYLCGVDRLIFMGSSCIYPRNSPQPITESCLMTGPLESTNSAYAVAKIAGIEMCWAYNRQYHTRFVPVMPTNLYGPNDNFDPGTSHVLPALIHKFHEAKQAGSPFVIVWGTGSPKREFLHVDDLAEACLMLMNIKFPGKIYRDNPLINIGIGTDITIKDLAELIKQIVGYTGDIVFDPSKPDGTPEKRLDVLQMRKMGWQAKITLKQGIKDTYSAYLKENK
jgi:GDP-L-fucose synthase